MGRQTKSNTGQPDHQIVSGNDIVNVSGNIFPAKNSAKMAEFYKFRALAL